MLETLPKTEREKYPSFFLLAAISCQHLPLAETSYRPADSELGKPNL